jgi:hypothetical protein
LATAEDEDFVTAFVEELGAISRNVSGPADEKHDHDENLKT